MSTMNKTYDADDFNHSGNDFPNEIESPEDLDRDIYHNGHPDAEVVAGSDECTPRKDTDVIPGDPIHNDSEIADEGESIEDALNMTQPMEKSDPEPTQPLNVTQTVHHASTPPGVTDANITSTLALDAVHPPVAMHASVDSMHESSESSLENEDKVRRRTYHVRNNTVTVPNGENIIAKEVADVINELVNSPPDALMTILQAKFTELAMEKEAQWRAEFEKSANRAKALHELKQKIEESTVAAAQPTASQPTSKPPSRPPSPGIDIERLIRERDQSREHAASSARTLREVFKQQELLMEKERSHQEHLKHVQNEIDATNATMNELHMRYGALLADAEEELLQADVSVEKVKRELEDSMFTLRFKVRQQEMVMRSLQATIESLQNEKKELLDICDDLVARTETTQTQIQVDNREF